MDIKSETTTKIDFTAEEIKQALIEVLMRNGYPVNENQGVKTTVNFSVYPDDYENPNSSCSFGGATVTLVTKNKKV